MVRCGVVWCGGEELGIVLCCVLRGGTLAVARCVWDRLTFPKSIPANGSAGTQALKERICLFQNGEWLQLLAASRNMPTCSLSDSSSREDEDQTCAQKVKKVILLISKGELNHAARLLRSRGRAPGTEDTLLQLNDPNL